MSDYKYYATELQNVQHIHPYQKLQKFAQMTIKAHYSNHELYETFLDEWEFQINEKDRKVKALWLFNPQAKSISIKHEFPVELQSKYYDYFEKIGLFEWMNSMRGQRG